MEWGRRVSNARPEALEKISEEFMSRDLPLMPGYKMRRAPEAPSMSFFEKLTQRCLST
jgi:hypothetical protein